MNPYMKDTSVSVDGETWKLLDDLHEEMGESKRKLVRIAIRHIADCEEFGRALSALGYNSEAIVRIVRDSCELS